MGECGERERAVGGPEREGCDEGVGDGPVEAAGLVGGHGASAFFEGRDGEGVGDLGRGARRGLEEELVGDGGVFVFVAAALADVLVECGRVSCRSGSNMGRSVSGFVVLLTDFATGPLAMSPGWKLNTPF